MKIPKIPANVWYLGFVSLLNDTASEMLYPVMPIFITQVLGAPVFVIGIIEGVAEGSSSIFKTLFGYWSDRVGKRKPFVIGGYLASAVAKIIIAMSYIWPLVFLGRFVDRFGKGLRTAARDALLLDATTENDKGLIFGVHRSMDTLGAVLGPSIALVLLWAYKNNIRLILLLAIVPAFLSLLFFFKVREAKTRVETTKMKLSLSISKLSPNLKLFLLGLAVFSLGNSTDSFLILRAKNMGLSLALVISAFILYNIVYAAASTPAGAISDRIGKMKVFVVGIIIFALVYLGFAFNTNPVLVWVLFAVYGFYIALTDGVSKALVGSMIQKEEAGTAYGVMTTTMSICALFASIVGGVLWSVIAPEATFIFAAVCAILSLFIFNFVRTR